MGGLSPLLFVKEGMNEKQKVLQEKRILGGLRKAVQDYDMIHDGDRIAVGVSGGKDSIALLMGLLKLKQILKINYSIVAITIDAQFPNSIGFNKIEEYCNTNKIEYHIIKTDIYEIVFQRRKEDNPCSLCSKMRRGALNEAAEQLQCNVLALGHHMDDVTDTFMLSLLFEGRFQTFQAVTTLPNNPIRLIRPLIYLHENTIESYVKAMNAPVVISSCPEDGNTERKEMNKYLNQMEREHRGVRHRIFLALQKENIAGYQIKDKEETNGQE